MLGTIFGTLVMVTCSSSSRINTTNQPTPEVVVLCLLGNITDSRFFTLSNVGIPESSTGFSFLKKKLPDFPVPKHP